MFQLLYQMVRILPSILGCEGKNGEHGPLLPAKNSYLTALEFLTNKSVFTDYCYRLLRPYTLQILLLLLMTVKVMPFVFTGEFMVCRKRLKRLMRNPEIN